MPNSLGRFGLRRPASGMSGLDTEIKRYERRWIDTSDYKIRTVPALGPSRLREEALLAARNFDPATLVTPTVRCPALVYLTTTNQHVVSKIERTTTDT